MTLRAAFSVAEASMPVPERSSILRALIVCGFATSPEVAWMKTLLPVPPSPPFRTISGLPVMVWAALVRIPARLLAPPAPPVTRISPGTLSVCAPPNCELMNAELLVPPEPPSMTTLPALMACAPLIVSGLFVPLNMPAAPAAVAASFSRPSTLKSCPPPNVELMNAPLFDPPAPPWRMTSAADISC